MEKTKTENLFDNRNNLSEAETQQVRSILQLFPVHNHDGRNSLEVATKKVKRSILSEAITSVGEFITGEAISNGNSVRVSGSQLRVWEALGTQGDVQVMATTGNNRVAQSFIVQNVDTSTNAGIKKIMVGVRRSGATYSGSLTIRLETDNANKPSGTVVSGSSGTVSIPAGIENKQLTLTYSSPISLTVGTKYWIVFWCSGSDANDIYGSGSNVNSVIGTRSVTTDGGSTWSTQATDDAYFYVEWVENAGRVLKSDSQTQDKINHFLGIADMDASSGASIEVISYGYKKDFTNLNNVFYYLTDTAGTIGTTAGTYSKVVGFGITEKILKITS